MADEPIISVAEVKDHLAIVGTARDARLERIVAGVDEFIRSQTRRDWKQVSRVEARATDGTSAELILRHTPTPTLTALTVQGVVWDVTNAALVVLSPNGILHRTDGAFWPDTRRAPTVVVTYTGGPATVPYSLRLAALEMVGYVVRAGSGRNNVSAGGQSEAFTSEMLSRLPTVAETLDRYGDDAAAWL